MYKESYHLLAQILTKYNHLLQNPGKNCIHIDMKLSSYAKHIGIHYNTAWRMWKRGQIDGYQLPTGTVIINAPVEQKGAAPPKQQIVAIYARVSASEPGPLGSLAARALSGHVVDLASGSSVYSSRATPAL